MTPVRAIDLGPLSDEELVALFAEAAEEIARRGLPASRVPWALPPVRWQRLADTDELLAREIDRIPREEAEGDG